MRAEGCTEAQGYFYGKPMPANEIAQLLSGAEMSAAADLVASSGPACEVTPVTPSADRRNSRAGRR